MQSRLRFQIRLKVVERVVRFHHRTERHSVPTVRTIAGVRVHVAGAPSKTLHSNVVWFRGCHWRSVLIVVRLLRRFLLCSRMLHERATHFAVDFCAISLPQRSKWTLRIVIQRQIQHLCFKHFHRLEIDLPVSHPLQ